MQKKPVTLAMMDVSTGHLSTATRAWLERKDVLAKHGFMSRDTGYAMSSYLGANEEWKNHQDLPEDLIHVLRYAHANKFDWILFDADAEADPNLPWYGDNNFGKPDVPDNLSADSLSSKNGAAIWAVDPVTVETEDLVIAEGTKPGEVQLEDENYAIPEKQGVWLSVGGASVRVFDGGGFVAVNVFVNGFEMDDALHSFAIEKHDIESVRSDLENPTDYSEPD